jgi:fructose-1,6-bisphosphatase-3
MMNMDIRYLKLLADQFPNEEAAGAELVRLKGVMRLHKGTELFLSDIHGEDEAFLHILNNASGIIYEKIETALGDTLPPEKMQALASLIYYPHEKLIGHEEEVVESAAWYDEIIRALVLVCRETASKYSRRYVRDAFPAPYGDILEELLGENSPDNKEAYIGAIIDSIVGTDQARQVILALCAVIKRLAVARLHIVGDLYDRGPHTDTIIDALIAYHSADIQWGNHDVLWMGAAAGSPACVAAAVRNCIQYNMLDMLENGYGINLLPLALFAEATYEDAEHFIPRIEPDELYMPRNPQLYARMHKAISVIQYKLEGALVARRPEYGMEDRDVFSRVDFEQGTYSFKGRQLKLKDADFPTVNPSDPNGLTNAEYMLIGQLVDAFRRSGRLQRHARFLYRAGSLYLKYNGNLLYHGCIPADDEGKFLAFRFGDKTYSGRAMLDYCDYMARQGYFAPENSPLRKEGRDFLWFLWCGRNSPLFGRQHITTFERVLLDEKETWKEKQNAYYRLYDDEAFIRTIFEDFGLDKPWSRIINGHVPVRASKGEDPRKAGGRLIVIDGGFSKAYHGRTGIAGYTMFFSSHGIRIAAHEPFTSRAEAIAGNLDIRSQSMIIDNLPRRLLVADTDEGVDVARRMEDLEALITAYRDGRIRQNTIR